MSEEDCNCWQCKCEYVTAKELFWDKLRNKQKVKEMNKNV